MKRRLRRCGFKQGRVRSEFVATELVDFEETQSTGVVLFTGDNVLVTADREIYTEDAVLLAADGNLTEIDTNRRRHRRLRGRHRLVNRARRPFRHRRRGQLRRRDLLVRVGAARQEAWKARGRLPRVGEPAASFSKRDPLVSNQSESASHSAVSRSVTKVRTKPPRIAALIASRLLIPPATATKSTPGLSVILTSDSAGMEKNLLL